MDPNGIAVGTLVTLVFVAVWLRAELSRVRVSGMLHLEPINRTQQVDHLRDELQDRMTELQAARAAMDELKEALERRSNGQEIRK